MTATDVVQGCVKSKFGGFSKANPQVAAKWMGYGNNDEFEGLVIHRSGNHQWDVYFQHKTGKAPKWQLPACTALHIDNPAERENGRKAMLVTYSTKMINASLMNTDHVPWCNLPKAICGELEWDEDPQANDQAGKGAGGKEPAADQEEGHTTQASNEDRTERAQRRNRIKMVLASAKVHDMAWSAIHVESLFLAPHSNTARAGVH